MKFGTFYRLGDKEIASNTTDSTPIFIFLLDDIFSNF